ncbi:endonuclease III-like protein 1 isoform X2 [Phymastichus coffea]|nr:endonuclease III-like protein 1 isoform X2 [Phymastichus coffea]
MDIGQKIKSNSKCSKEQFVIECKETKCNTEIAIGNDAMSKNVKLHYPLQNIYKIEDTEKNNWVPYNWERQLKNIRQMRCNLLAPVDKMGCHKCADKLAEAPIFRFQSLIALMLSSQTKDKVTFEAMNRLKKINCSPLIIASMSDEELEKLIYPVSFWKRKAQYLKRTSKILLEDYNGDIPKNVEALCALPGIGPKMGHICMQVAWNEITGIGVDTHVHRISNRLKWVQKPTKNSEETRIALESWLPKELWAEINQLFVGFGQEICRSRNPQCFNCLNCTICPYVTNKYQF